MLTLHPLLQRGSIRVDIMATQPEPLKFGPQWIRKLSDCTLPSQRTSAKSPVNKTLDLVTSASDDISGTKCVSYFSDRSVKQSRDYLEPSVWDPILAPAFDSGDKKDSAPHRPRTKDDNNNTKVAQSHGPPFCPLNSQLSNNNNNGFNSDSSRLPQVNQNSETALAWSSKTSNFSASDRNWRRRPVSTSAQPSSKFSSNGSSPTSKWKPSSVTANQINLCNENPVAETSSASNQPSHGSKAAESPEVRTSNDSTACTADQDSPRDPTVPGKSTVSGGPLCEVISETQSSQQPPHHSPTDTSLAPPISKTLTGTQTKRAVSAYFGMQSSSQKRFSDTEPSTNLLWDQHLWSKSVPQRLHGPEPGAADVFSASLAGLLVQNAGINVTESSSVPGPGRFDGFVDSLNPSNLADPIASFQPGTSHGTAVSDSYSTLDETRGFHRPDGADCPDEHMWLYEDPQGRTQGTFSDAQMQEWLLAGIYFTPTLRIRRKCDDSFSTLADYTRLFGRVPFVPSFRVPPIRGGITPQLLNLAATKSGQLSSTDVSSSPDSLHSTRPVGPGAVAATVGAPLSSAFHPSTTSTTLSLPGSLESATASVVGRSPITMHPLHRSAYPHRSDTSDYSGPTGSMHLASNPLMEDTRNAAHLKTTGGMCANSSLPVLHNRNPGGPMLLTHSLGGLDLSGGLGTSEAESQPNSNTSHPQPVAPDSTLMTLASLISMNPALASLALPFAGQAITGNTSSADFAAAAISPGFLAALAQYLKVQPHPSGHQSVSPMQQLAETAQLAAQLAAMVGAHSPDQTPMQPAQALALAQLVMSQATPFPEQQWASLSKRETVPIDHAQDAGVTDRRADRTTTDESARSRAHLPHEPTGTAAVGDESHSNSQPTWSVGFATSNAGSRISPRAVEGRAVSKNASDNTAQTGCDIDRSRDGPLRTGGLGFSSSRLQTKGQSKSTTQRSVASVTSGKTQNGFPSSLARDAHGNNGNAETIHSSTVATTYGVPNAGSAAWRWPAASESVDAKKNPEVSASGDRDISQKSNPSGKQPTNQWVNKSKSTSQASPANGNIRSPLKTTGTTMNQSKLGHVIVTTTSMASTTDSRLTSSHPTTTSTATSTSAESDRTAEHELEQLTQWCQTRLSSFPMREKVDIPTVVELLATLDAPYEVERMVQTFLGESARTSQFVKDFLDHRRPFWQLHRERRERESQVKSGSKSQTAGTNQSNTPRSGEKKKRAHAQDATSRVNQNSSCNGSPSWHKVGGSSQGNQTDPTQDNEWHQIKPKGNHNRKGRKDKA